MRKREKNGPGGVESERERKREKRNVSVRKTLEHSPNFHSLSLNCCCLFVLQWKHFLSSFCRQERERWKVKKEGRGRGTWKNIALLLSFLFSDMNPLKKKKLPAKKSAWSHLNVYKDNKLRVVLLFSYQTDVTLKSWPMCIFSKKLFFIIDYRGSSVIFIMDKGIVNTVRG